VARFLHAYCEVNTLEASVLEVLPALLAAKRLHRALGRYQRLLKGQVLSLGDTKKIMLEAARLRWLEAPRPQLRATLGVARHAANGNGNGAA
jgi:hypothetical protein